jgi:hypothetical protein
MQARPMAMPSIAIGAHLAGGGWLVAHDCVVQVAD